MQPDSSLSQEQSSPTPEVRKPRKFIIPLVFLVILILVACGLGYWTMKLNTTLKAAQGDLATLNVQYNDLTSQKEAVSTELDQTTNELEQIRAEIATINESAATIKSEAAKVNNAIAAMKKKMESARVYVDVMRTIFEDDDEEAALDLTKDMNDSKLEELLSAFMDKPDYEKTWLPFAGYLLSTVVDILTK